VLDKADHTRVLSPTHIKDDRQRFCTFKDK